nr:T9SS type A sorting domain-containing protein [uncultured Chitinophaga sp.]
MNPAARFLPNIALTVTCIAFLLHIPHISRGQATRLSFDASTYKWPNSSPGKVISADFDNDTKDEIIVASPKQKKLYIWEGIPGGEGQSWRMKDSISLESRMLSFCIGDIDGDSKIDIITLSDRKGDNSIIDIFLNRSVPGSVKFEKKYSIETNGLAYDVAAEDLDGDHKKDLIVADFDKKSLTFLGNATARGMISFSGSTHPLGIRPNYFIVKDINGDKKPDLIVSDYDKNALFVLQNSTSSQAGIFFTQVDKLVTGSGPIACVAEDLDGDKMPDIAVANLFGHSLSVYQNVSSPNSQTHFADANVSIPIKRPSSLAAGDLDGDGMPEIAVTSEKDNSIVILKNYASLHNISLDKISEIPVGKAPQYVYMKKAGKSKQLDLIVSNSYSDNFLVLKHLQAKERQSLVDTVSILKQNGDPTEKITIYPNPASSIVHISFSSSVKRSGPVLLRIINASGQEVARERHDATNLITMDISRLSAGIYWCQISSPGHYPKTRQLVVE